MLRLLITVLLIVVWMCGYTDIASAQSYAGIDGFRVWDARTIGKGFGLEVRGYFKELKDTVDNKISLMYFTPNFTWGFSDRFELFFQLPYQMEKYTFSTGDTTFSGTLGSMLALKLMLSNPSKSTAYTIQAHLMDLPTYGGDYKDDDDIDENDPKMDYGVNFLMTQNFDKGAFKLNVGYMAYGEEKAEGDDDTYWIPLGAGLHYFLTPNIYLMGELAYELHPGIPDSIIAMSEMPFYFTPSLNFVTNEGLSISIGADMLLSSNDDNTPYDPTAPHVGGWGSSKTALFAAIGATFAAAPKPVEAAAPAKSAYADMDDDGVYDDADRCPGTPRGCLVDLSGCEMDGDSDGICDGLDRCPDTQAGGIVDQNGCPMETDADGDGIMDPMDRCPHTRIGCAVDDRGCAIDEDGDGVCDGLDRCPGTSIGALVDDDGCSTQPEPKATTGDLYFPFVLEGIRFYPGGAIIDPNSNYYKADQLANWLLANPDAVVELQGYTDNRGDYSSLVDISQRRAEQVKAYLVGKGVKGSQIYTKGYGPTNFIASNKLEEGRARNRRIEVARIK